MWEETQPHCRKGLLPHGPSQHHSVWLQIFLFVSLDKIFWIWFHVSSVACLLIIPRLILYALDTFGHPLLLPHFLFYMLLSFQHPCFVHCPWKDFASSKKLERWSQEAWVGSCSCCYILTSSSLQCKSYWLCNIYKYFLKFFCKVPSMLSGLCNLQISINENKLRSNTALPSTPPQWLSHLTLHVTSYLFIFADLSSLLRTAEALPPGSHTSHTGHKTFQGWAFHPLLSALAV